MKKYKASDLSHKRAEVMKEARNGGVIIQECRTNGEVLQEFLLVDKHFIHSIIDRLDTMCNDDIYQYCHRPLFKEVDGILNDLER